MNHAQELIEKDDAARDLLGLEKPTLLDFKEMTNLRNLNQKEHDVLALKYNLMDKSASGSGGAKKRP